MPNQILYGALKSSLSPVMSSDTTGPTVQSKRNPEELFTSKQLADFLKVGERLPESWRLQGTGPRYIRVGGRRGRVVYRWADIATYLEGRSFSSTAEESARAA